MPIANKFDCAGLRSLLSFFLDELYRCTDLQVTESTIQHAVLVKVNLSSARRFQETVSFG
jgi:hypothetical protein